MLSRVSCSRFSDDAKIKHKAFLSIATIQRLRIAQNCMECSTVHRKYYDCSRFPDTFLLGWFLVFTVKKFHKFSFFHKGNWVDDERNGHGILEYGTGEVYEGEFKNDKLREFSDRKYF